MKLSANKISQQFSDELDSLKYLKPSDKERLRLLDPDLKLLILKSRDAIDFSSRVLKDFPNMLATEFMEKYALAQKFLNARQALQFSLRERFKRIGQ